MLIRSRLHPLTTALLLLLAVAAVASPAAAAGKKKTAAKAPAQNPAVVEAERMMAMGTREGVEAGIQSLGLLGTEAAVAPLTARIRQGLPADLLETAIVTLMALGQPSGGPVLIELTHHRRPEIRLRAIEALAALNAPGAEAALLSALSDSDANVRVAAATGLGDVGSQGAIERLFVALDHGNMEASGSIGRLIPAANATRLLEYVGRVPLHNLGPALGQVLQRKDVKEAVKLEIVARLEEVGTREVKAYFGELVATAGEALGPNVSRAVLRAMQEIAD